MYVYLWTYHILYIYIICIYILVDTKWDQSFQWPLWDQPMRRLFQRCKRQWHRKDIIEAIAGSPPSVPTMSFGRALGFSYADLVIELVYSGCCYTGIMIIYIYIYLCIHIIRAFLLHY